MPANNIERIEMKKTNITLQEHFFRISLSEIGIWDGLIKIDHKNGKVFHEETGWIPLVFPEMMLSMIDLISKEKKINYFFQGVISQNRNWIKKFENTSESFRGRKKNKYTFDTEYYIKMSQSKFCLAPIGDCPWSYRFFESIMCHSFPILGKDENDIFSSNFTYFREHEEHIFCEKKANKNLDILVSNHTLRGLGFR